MRLFEYGQLSARPHCALSCHALPNFSWLAAQATGDLRCLGARASGCPTVGNAILIPQLVGLAVGVSRPGRVRRDWWRDAGIRTEPLLVPRGLPLAVKPSTSAVESAMLYKDIETSGWARTARPICCQLDNIRTLLRCPMFQVDHAAKIRQP